MKILVVGATGKSGELTWCKAVAVGHDVTVFGRSVAQRYKDDLVTKYRVMCWTVRLSSLRLLDRMPC
jgi:uncharacterized protein YbjT (DUF2867 family)